VTGPTPEQVRHGIDVAQRNWTQYWQAVVAGLCEHTELSRAEALQFITLTTVTETHRKMDVFQDYIIDVVERSAHGDEEPYRS